LFPSGASGNVRSFLRTCLSFGFLSDDSRPALSSPQKLASAFTLLAAGNIEVCHSWQLGSVGNNVFYNTPHRCHRRLETPSA
jgi:hypothetical protein